MLLEIFNYSCWQVEVFFTVSKSKLFIEVKTPSIELTLVSNASSMSTACRHLDNFLILKLLDKYGLSNAVRIIRAIICRLEIQSLGFKLLSLLPDTQTAMRQFSKGIYFILIIQDK
jgi:hypothetical protein